MKELVYPRLLLQRAEQLADKVAFVDVTRDGLRYQGTFADHLDRLLRLVSAMKSELGAKPRGRFAVLAMNGHEYLELYHAAMFGAGIINPLNIRFTPSELAYVINDSGSRVVFTDPSLRPGSGPSPRGGGEDRQGHRHRRWVSRPVDGGRPQPHRLRGPGEGRRTGHPTRARRERSPRFSCTPGEPRASPRVPCSSSEQRCSTCTTCSR